MDRRHYITRVQAGRVRFETDSCLPFSSHLLERRPGERPARKQAYREVSKPQTKDLQREAPLDKLVLYHLGLGGTAFSYGTVPGFDAVFFHRKRSGKFYGNY